MFRNGDRVRVTFPGSVGAALGNTTGGDLIGTVISSREVLPGLVEYVVSAPYGTVRAAGSHVQAAPPLRPRFELGAVVGFDFDGDAYEGEVVELERDVDTYVYRVDCGHGVEAVVLESDLRLLVSGAEIEAAYLADLEGRLWEGVL